MDPGTAVGVASLGIQICQGLLEYYHDWKDYNDDVRETYTELSEFSRTLALLNDKLQKSPSTAFLDKNLKKIRKETPTGYRQKAQAEGLRLLYPFRKSTLDKLKGIVQCLMQQLSLAIQLVQLDTNDSTRDTACQIKDTVDSISDLTTKIQTSTLDTRSQVSTTAALVRALMTKEEQEKLEKILTWLSAPDRSIEHNAARKKHEAGTGEWLLKGESYQKWISGTSPVLWVHGKAGCCKTVLFSTVIEDVRGRLAGHNDVILAYFYFTFADTGKQTYRSLPLSLVTELSRGRPIHPALQASYEESLPNSPSDETLEATLMALLQEANEIFIAVDALDECPEEQREEVVEGLKSIAQAYPGTRILMTSRREADIEELIDPWCETQLALDESCVNADIDIYVRNALATDRKLKRLPDATKTEITRMFHAKSDGMFRWATLQLQALRNLKVLQPSYIFDALYKMPRTLDETYERMLAAIEDLYFDEARTALQWLLFSNAPLSIAELAEACSISYTSDTAPFLKNGGHADIMGLLNVLGNLILVSDPAKFYSWTDEKPDPPKYDPEFHLRRVRLSHFSVQEYLVSDRLRNSGKEISRYALHEITANFDLAQKCCAYLLFFTSEPSPQIQKWIDDEELPLEDFIAAYVGVLTFMNHLDRFEPRYPLLGYCSHQWTALLKIAENGMGSLPEDGLLHLQVLEQERVTATWLRLGQTSRDLKGPSTERYRFRSSKGMEKKGWNDRTRALYWASCFRLRKTVTLLCDLLSRQDIDYNGGKVGTALQAAAYWGDVALVKAFLERGSNANLQGGLLGSALQIAAQGGFTKIVSILLEAVFNAERLSVGMGNATPYVGVQRRNIQVLKSFLYATDIFSDDDISQAQIFAILKTAVKDCNEVLLKQMESVIEEILSSPERQLLAAAEGCEERTRMVLEISIAVSSVLDGLFLSAIKQGRIAVAEALIGAGANATRAAFQEAIRLMSQDGAKGEVIAELLIHSGLEITGDHQSLIAATSVGSARLVQLLLKAGADVNSHAPPNHDRFETKGQHFRLHTENALAIAVRRQDVVIVQLLLDAAADPNEEFTLFVTSYNDRSVVRCTTTALAMTIYFGLIKNSLEASIDISRKLINAGVNTYDGGNALCKGIESYFFVNSTTQLQSTDFDFISNVVDLLLEHHADLNGPLACTPRLFQNSRKVGLDDGVKWAVGELFSGNESWLWAMEKYIGRFQSFSDAVLLSGVLIGQEEAVSLLLEKEREAKATVGMDTSRACELFAAACWTYVKPKDCVKIITMVLDSLLDVRGAEDDIFEGILHDGSPESSMERFLVYENAKLGQQRSKHWCKSVVRVFILSLMEKTEVELDTRL